MRKSDIYKLPYNKVTFKASHNSEELQASIIEQLNETGCSGIELDVVQAKSKWAWCVQHEGRYTDKEKLQLSTFLQIIKKWMNEKRRVITIHIDLKNAPLNNTEFPEHIDEYILKIIPKAKIFQPKELIGDCKNLVSGAQKNGWPTLCELEGKIIICLTGHKKRKAIYAKTNPKERVCFSDIRVEINSRQYPLDLLDGTCIFLNFKLNNADYDHEQVSRIAKEKAYVKRCFVVNDAELWSKAQRSEFNIIATDKIHDRWAHNGEYLFGIRTKKDIKMSESSMIVLHKKRSDHEQTSSKIDKSGSFYSHDQ